MNNLILPQVASNQNQKEVTINDQVMAIDAAMTERLAVDLSLGPVTLLAADFTRNYLFVCAGHTGTEVLTVPAIRRAFAVRNDGTGPLAVGAVTVPTGETRQLYSDGTTVSEIGGGGGGGGGGIPDVPSSSPHVRVSGDWIKLVAGSNVTLDDTTPGELKVAATGGGGSAGALPIVAVSGSVALTSMNLSQYLRFSAGTPSVTIAKNETGISVSDEWTVYGTVPVMITPAVDVVMNKPSGYDLIVPAGGAVVIKKVDDNEYDIIGLLAASS